jgi:hypothetical protein
MPPRESTSIGRAPIQYWKMEMSWGAKLQRMFSSVLTVPRLSRFE